MAKKTARANNAFLLGSILMIILVLLVVVLFLFLAFKIYDRKEDAYSERYEIRLEQSLVGCPTTLFINDSLLFQGTPGAPMTLTVGRFATESSLLVVDGGTDVVTTLELPVESAKIEIGKNQVNCQSKEAGTVRISR